jgi:molybdopterin/thiamine biosynthesis adenylyltransferase
MSDKREFKIPVACRIAVAGAGGLGSHFTGLLYDFGVNREQFPFAQYVVDVYDDDTVDTSNLLHQNYTSQDLGLMKADVLAARYLVNAVTRRMTPEDFPKYDIIFSCVDNMDFRRQLYQAGWDKKYLGFWVDGRCSSRQIGIFNSDRRKDLLEPLLVGGTEQKSAGCLREVDKVAKISHATPVIVAGFMMQQFLNWLRGEVNSNPFILMV